MIHMLAYNTRNSFKDRDMQINLDNKHIRWYISPLTSNQARPHPALMSSPSLERFIQLGLGQIYSDSL